jgi:membrane protein
MMPSLPTLSPRHLWLRTRQILGHVHSGFWADDGFMLSGHLAYLALLGIFPFFIFVAAVAGWFGNTEAGVQLVSSFLTALPGEVANALRAPITQVIGHQRRGILAFGLIVAVWTAGSVIETIRVVIHKAYDHSAGRPFWQYRIQSFIIVIASTIMLLAGMGAQFALSGAKRFFNDHLPAATATLDTIALLRQYITPLILFLALYGLYAALTPRAARFARHWPGAVLTVMVWMTTATLLPRVIGLFGGYDLTYGSLAGVMVTLLFFYVVGAGLVVGAHLNAALRLYWPKLKPENRLDDATKPSEKTT